MSKPPSKNQTLTPAELLAFGDPEAAERQLRAILQKQHDNLDAQIELIRLFLFQGEHKKARSEVMKAKHQWPGEGRLDGLLRCAERGERKHTRLNRRIKTGEADHVSTSDKRFHLLRSIFCFVVAALAYAIFYYYTQYLDGSTNGSAAGTRTISPPLATLVIHTAFYLVWIGVVLHGLKNLLQYFLLPEIVAVGPQGFVLANKVNRLTLDWGNVQSVTRMHRRKWNAKDNLWISDEWLKIESTRRLGLLSRVFLTQIPRASLARFQALVQAIEKHTTVKTESTETSRFLDLQSF